MQKATVRNQNPTATTNCCEERWLQAAEVYCELERGHTGEHCAKAIMEFAAGHVGKCQIWWQSPKIPLVKPAKKGV